jgi:hypothetical protein
MGTTGRFPGGAPTGGMVAQQEDAFATLAQNQQTQPSSPVEQPQATPTLSPADLEAANAAAIARNLAENDKVTESRISEKQALLKEAAQEVAPQGISGQDASQLQNQRGGSGQEL